MDENHALVGFMNNFFPYLNTSYFQPESFKNMSNLAKTLSKKSDFIQYMHHNRIDNENINIVTKCKSCLFEEENDMIVSKSSQESPPFNKSKNVYFEMNHTEILLSEKLKNLIEDYIMK